MNSAPIELEQLLAGGLCLSCWELLELLETLPVAEGHAGELRRQVLHAQPSVWQLRVPLEPGAGLPYGQLLVSRQRDLFTVWGLN